MSKGKQLEKTIRLIQETFKDSENTQIYSNYKMPNESGNNREIDILIVSKINDFEINIAIECKDFKKKVPVEKIEAFQSKCDRLKKISKKIFISSNGFQSDAINSAKYYNIELFIAEELTQKTLKSLFPIRQIKPEILPIINNAVLTFDTDEETLSKFEKTCTDNIYRKDYKEPEKIQDILFEAIGKYTKEIFSLALFEWMKMENKDKEEVTFPVNFGLNFHDCYVKTENQIKIELLSGSFDVLVKFGFVYPELISGRTLKDSKGSTKAKTVDIKIKDDLESHMIIKPNNDFDFYVTDKGTTRKLETLFTYNPKTDKLIKPK